VLEAVPAPVAQEITATLSIPTIGIGAGADCDGQVLVWHDLLGLYAGHAPRFVKQYANLAPEITEALGRFVGDVRSGAFPEAQHTYSMPDEELALFSDAVAHEFGSVDRSVQTAARVKPARPGDGTASGASEGVEHAHGNR
jgi:3-methyl-2-oxobutanoate hydroxymethyltransferase